MKTEINKSSSATASGTNLLVQSPNIRYTQEVIESDYVYDNVRVNRDTLTNTVKATPVQTKMTFRTQRAVPRTGVMLVGWGGNNGSTLTGAILANRHGMTWETKEGRVRANYFGSITQASTVLLGVSDTGSDEYIPMRDFVPMVDPNELVIDGWDISGLDLAESMSRAKVLDIQLQNQIRPLMAGLRPRPGIYDPDFIAANQNDRADNVIPRSGATAGKMGQVDALRADIRDFKARENLDQVLVLWTANTERFTDVAAGIHDTADNLLAAIQANEPELAPSCLYAVAAILEGCSYINGSPQNTFVPGLVQLAEQRGVFIGGDDFKSGQTKFKSVLVDFLVSAGIKPCSIVSYNHLGNNDGLNLSSARQFRSKEISKSNVVDDMVASNSILFGNGSNGEMTKPDHTVVIKYVPYVADSKRAMDEYISELMMGGKNTIVVHNTCEDSLLATPLILDLIILTELCQRVSFRVHGQEESYQGFNSILSILSYLCKAPMVESRGRVTNALFKQRSQIENILRALVALPAINHMDMQYKCSDYSAWREELTEPLRSSKKVPEPIQEDGTRQNGVNGHC